MSGKETTIKKFAFGCGVVLALFIAVIIISVYTATRPPSSVDETALEVELIQAETKGLIEVSAYGAGSLEWINLNITSRMDQPLKVVILPGTIFEAQSTNVQNMVIRKKRVIVVKPGGTTESKRVAAACANMRLDMPGESDNLKLRTERASEDLIQLLNLPELHEEPFRTQQFAIWTITDNPPPGGYVGIVYGYYGVALGPSDEDIERIRTLFEKAEIPTDKYQALR